jgi:mRNA-degrading endonuclease RelE of RelBE toxin-antitoxin system
MNFDMSYTIIAVPHFRSELKRLVKKYPSLKDEYIELVKELKENPEQGTPLGNNLYKIRLAIASKGKGKSGGARVITYLKTEQGNVYLLSIYDKGERGSISDKEIKNILKAEAGE